MLRNVLRQHNTSYVSYLGFNYSNVVGLVLLITFVLQFATGLLLTLYYTYGYTPLSGYSGVVYAKSCAFSMQVVGYTTFASVYTIMNEIVEGYVVRVLHILGSSIYMLLLIVHFQRGYFLRIKRTTQAGLGHHYFGQSPFNSFSAGGLQAQFQAGPFLYSSQSRFYGRTYTKSKVWFIGVAILVVSLGTGFIGYCLCLGQMSYWGITVMINVIAIVPFMLYYLALSLASLFLLLSAAFVLLVPFL